MKVLAFAKTVFVLLCVATPAAAHIQLDYPTARTTAQKAGPCGAADSVRGQNVTELIAGETITVVWRETVNHPGHYRISFDADGQDDFVEPASFTDFYTNSSVLHDEIADKQGGDYTFDVVVPNTPCDTCTLQVVQVMTDKAPYGDGNDLYYQCADIRIVAADTGDVGTPLPDMGTPDMGTPEPDMGSSNNTANNTTNNAINNATNNATNNGNTVGTTNTDTSSDDDGCSVAGGGSAFFGLLLIAGLARRRRTR